MYCLHGLRILFSFLGCVGGWLLFLACSSTSTPTDGQLQDAQAQESTAEPEPAEPATQRGCGDTVLLQVPSDPSTKGPWPVGARTIVLSTYTVEVLYPALPGSEQGKTKIQYDVREHLPAEERNKIPETKAPFQPCDCYRDLPPDLKRGPYPVVWFIHGTAGFRTQSLQHMQHWASRGFVVMSADHPGINLSDVLQLKIQFGKQGEDMRILLKALREQPASLSFFQNRLDLGRMAISGHSAGGSALTDLGDEKGVLVLIPMAAGGVNTEKPPTSTLILGGMEDGIVPYTRQQEGYKNSPKTKRLVGLKKAGHLAFSDLCVIGKEQGGLLKIAKDSGVKIPDVFGALIDTLATDGCKEGQLDPQKGWEIIHYTSSAVLEETLHCSANAAQAWTLFSNRFQGLTEFQQDLK